jgi:hypothetical protein
MMINPIQLVLLVQVLEQLLHLHQAMLLVNSYQYLQEVLQVLPPQHPPRPVLQLFLEVELLFKFQLKVTQLNQSLMIISLWHFL